MEMSNMAMGPSGPIYVRYKLKNELGLIGEVTAHGLRCWYHLGGTRALTNYEDVEVIDLRKVLATTFSNEYCKASLIERAHRLFTGGDVSDLIDDRNVRDAVIRLVKKWEPQNE